MDTPYKEALFICCLARTSEKISVTSEDSSQVDRSWFSSPTGEPLLSPRFRSRPKQSESPRKVSMILLTVSQSMQSAHIHPPRYRDGPAESLQVRIKGRAVTGDITVRVCCRPPDQEAQMDKALYTQIGAAWHSQAMVLMGAFKHPSVCWRDFKHPSVCWRDKITRHLQPRKFLECTDEIFFSKWQRS